MISRVVYFNNRGEKKLFSRDELSFGYRTSSFQKMKGAIVEVEGMLIGSQEAVQRQKAFLASRAKTQPLAQPSAGCCFKNPPEGSAGYFIDQAGLKGKSIGGAQVSSLHANFIVNTGGASAKDVLELLELIETQVRQTSGVELEREVRVINGC